MAKIKIHPSERDAMHARMLELRSKGLTQTAIGKELGLSGGTVSYYLTQRKAPDGQKQERSTSRKVRTEPNGLERHTSYAAGYCRAWLQVYAESLGIPWAELADGVVAVLRSQARR